MVKHKEGDDDNKGILDVGKDEERDKDLQLSQPSNKTQQHATISLFHLFQKYAAALIKLFIFTGSIAKTFSLNEAIAAEARNQNSIKLPRVPDTSIFQPTRTSPSKYRKTFLIKPPIIPKLLKRTQNRFPTKQIKQTKRELDKHEEFNQNYVPLFRSLSVILDNFLRTDSDEVIVPRNKFKRNPKTHDTNDIVCNCAYRSTTESHLSSSYEETIIPTFVSNEVETGTIASTPLTTPKTHRATVNYNRHLRRNKNISILPTRNTFSFRRNVNGFDERSGSTDIRHNKRTITRDNRNNEHNTRSTLIKSLAENSEKNTVRDSGNCSSLESRGGSRAKGPYTQNSFGKGNQTAELLDKSVSSIEGNLLEHKEQNQLPNRGIEAEGTELLPEYVSRIQGIEPENKREILQTKEKDYAAIERYITSAKRVSSRNSTNSTENKKHRGTNEAVTQLPPRLESPNKVVMIFDGYSVARDVNGENKMSEKAIEIRT
ncbi:uncharacterized protein LOC119838271 [Zerene cesonia]|uniref:uncharacterized protein LOC119838271 n=1 Tax=Zerene cesonia TaxID=33412 RepID=UPI0018E50D63|nr:uncharacterized protein LOC119838271 [Zerene cesonia]